MVEKYLGKDAAADIYMSALITGLMPEKQAESLAEGFEKDAFSWGLLLKGLKMIPGALKEVPNALAVGLKAPEAAWRWGGRGLSAAGLLALLGASTGVVGATALDVVKERVSQEDPEEKFNNDIESIYKNRTRELEDQKWMTRVRAMRDELRRGYKKMPTEEYAAKYQALQDALDERKD